MTIPDVTFALGRFNDFTTQLIDTLLIESTIQALKFSKNKQMSVTLRKTSGANLEVFVDPGIELV